MLAVRDVPLQVALAGRQECHRAHAARRGTNIQDICGVPMRCGRTRLLLLEGPLREHRRYRHHRQSDRRTESCEFGHGYSPCIDQ